MNFKGDSFPESFQLKLHQDWGTWSEDLHLAKSSSTVLSNRKVNIISAETEIFEDPAYQNEPTKVYVLHEVAPTFITIPIAQSSITWTWLTIIQSTPDGLEELFQKLHEMNAEDLLAAHSGEWNDFWEGNAISVEGDEELAKSIRSSMYAIASSLPSLKRFADNGPFYGLSPSGLGLGGPKLEGYQGHGFWDTETWMHPAILLLEQEWSRRLLNYRHLMRNAAYDNAKNTGYKGLRCVEADRKLRQFHSTPSLPTTYVYFISADFHGSRLSLVAT